MDSIIDRVRAGWATTTGKDGRSARGIGVGILILLTLLVALPALAGAEGEITVTAASHENRFPAQIKFVVEATSASEITSVTLRYKVVNDQAASFSKADFTPGTRVKAEYVWNTQRQYIPPGIELQYYWQIEDAAGNKLQTQPATLTVDDTRFEWQSLSAGHLTLYWYKGDQRFAQDLLDAGTRAVKQLGEEVGVGIERPVKILVYESQRDLLGALPPRGVEWTGGQAFPEAGIVVLTAPPTPGGRDYGLRTVPHELSHLIVHAATDNPYGGVPRWLDEGLAMYAEGELPPQYEEALRVAATAGILPSLPSLSGNFPTSPDESLVSYAMSHSVVKYLLAQYGRDKMSKLLAIFHDGSTPDDALRGAYGLDVAALENEWRASIGAKDSRTPEAAAAPQRETPEAAAPAPPATALPAPLPAPAPAGGRSCFGGLLGLAGAMGSLLLLAGRLRG